MRNIRLDQEKLDHNLFQLETEVPLKERSYNLILKFHEGHPHFITYFWMKTLNAPPPFCFFVKLLIVTFGKLCYGKEI